MFLKNDKKLEKISNFRKVVQRKKGLLELSLRELKTESNSDTPNKDHKVIPI